MSVVITTSLGDITIDLYTDKCPLTSKNFLKLCKIRYYNGCLFHKVEKDFAAQTGDPTGNGNGGDSIYKFLYGDQARFFSDEIHPDLKHSDFGTVAMASAGKNMNASQFYITLREDLDYLDGEHTVFGKVEEGHDVLRRINEAYVDEKGRPYKNIRIKHTYILDDPFDDPPQLAELIPDKSPEGKPAEEVADTRLEDDWVPLDEQLQPDELDELIRDREAHSRAVVLESIGDIPDSEIKPPENVLFVCKLNSVTQDEDLDTIFSRFGNVLSTEIIRDYKTGDSLGYAFIEFESKESCEQAYFKMDNALIDDRRIHVDFSQSVAKLWSSYRHSGKNQGNGCFKCGSIDHIAKNCTGSTSTKGTASKYALKDENTQRGDSKQKSYDMVFDGDDLEAPRNNGKRHREHRPVDDGKRSKGSESSRHRHAEYDRRDSRNDRRHNSQTKYEDRSNYNNSKDQGNNDTSQRDGVSRREVENGKYLSMRDGRQEGHRDRRNNDVSYSKSKSRHGDFERTHGQDDHRRDRYRDETKSSRDRDEKRRRACV